MMPCNDHDGVVFGMNTEAINDSEPCTPTPTSTLAPQPEPERTPIASLIKITFIDIFNL